MKEAVLKYTKKMSTKKPKNTMTSSSHSFLFWLAVPALLLWLSLGYVIGIIKDKPTWQPEKDTTGEKIIFQRGDYGEITEDLDLPLITFWFDDAWLSQYMIAYPILKSFDFAGTIAVPTNAIETQNYVNWSQLRVLQENGWEITNHSTVHNCEMDKWNMEEVLSEYEKSKLILWKNKLASDIFVSPCGVVNC